MVKPLFVLGYTQPQPASFSVFADARLLHRRLRYQDLPFSDDVVYIFDKQIEEARLLVVNKVDLLTDQAIEDVRTLLEKRLPGKPYIMQSSLTMVGIQSWLDEIQSKELDLADNPLELDYRRYGSGEARLAWISPETMRICLSMRASK